MSQIPSNVSQIVAVFVECILYGIYLVTFAASLQSIASSHPGLSWASQFKNKWPMLMVVLLLFILSTLNLVLGLLRIIAFIHHDIVGSGEAEQLGQDWLNILKSLSVNIQTMIADCVLIYRCWIVYSKSQRVVILPIALYLGGLACTVMDTILEVKIQAGKGIRFGGGQLLQVLIGFWVSTISINIYATSMIVLRIWRVESKSRGKNTLTPLYVTPHLSRLQTAMKAVIESGLLYTITSVTAFISVVAGSNSIFITTAIDMQAIGIAFNLILIRLNHHGEGTVATRSGNTVSTAIVFGHGDNSFPSRYSQGVLSNRRVDPKIIVNSGPRAGDVENKD